MRWRREQLDLLKSAPLALLVLLSIARVQCALGQHIAPTCPVNPFSSLEQPTSCEFNESSPATSIPKDEVTSLSLSELACPIPINATGDTNSHSDDRTPTATSTIPVDSVTESPSNASSSVTITVQSSPSVSSRTVKEHVWTEIDESLGQSWTPELEAEYAKAQQDFKLHTQAVAENAQSPIPTYPSKVGNQNAGTVPEFPSFAEWKERHLAASIQSVKDTRKESKDHRNQKTKEDQKSKPEQAEKATIEPGDNVSPLSGALDHLLEANDAVDNSNQKVEQTALSSDTQRIFHPVPHAGTGDPMLDPLISLRDRTNYASFDCSATLIRSSKSTKFASAILSSKKDRYMLTPCAETEKYIIVELCDEIQIDNIVLANLEFFSSMFKLFRVSGGTAYPESAGSWRDIGTFRASNARGMQVRWIALSLVVWFADCKSMFAGLPTARTYRRRVLPLSPH